MASQAQRIIERARRLPARERRRVVSALEASLAKSPKSIATSARRARSYHGPTYALSFGERLASLALRSSRHGG